MEKAKGGLGLSQGVALYVGAVLGTGVLFLPAVAAQTAGPASLLAWIAMIVLSAPLALSYAALSRARPDAAGFSESIERAFGARWGAVAGWLFLAQAPTGLVVVMLVAGEYAAAVVGQRWLIPAGFLLVALAVGLNLIGLSISARVQLAVLAVIVVGIVAVLSQAPRQIHAANFTPFFPYGPAPVGLAAAQLFRAFVGWEAITPLADQFRQPANMWLATVITLALVGLLYFALAFATVGSHAYGPGPAGQADLTKLAIGGFGQVAGPVVGLGGWLLTFPTVNAYMAGMSRLTAALGRRNQLPAWIGLISNGIPRRALAALAVVSVASFLVLLVTRLNIALVLPLPAANFIVIYVMSMAAATKLLPGRQRYVAAVAMVTCASVLVFLGPVLLWPLAIALAALAYQRRMKPV